MQCDMCGTNRNLVKAEVEGSVLDVCQECARFGKIVQVPKKVVLQKKAKPIRRQTSTIIERIVTDYYTRVRNARERKGLKQEDVAKLISEKESTYHKIENGQLNLSLALAKKLEQFFKITLIEEISEKSFAQISPNSQSGGNLTIGDMLRTKKS